MQTTLAAIAVVTVGYILAYLLFDRLRDRYGYVGGAEYVIIGLLLGPRVTGLLDAQQVQDLTPLVSLALGWLGMLLGTYFRLPTMALIEGAHLRIAFAEAVTTFAVALAGAARRVPLPRGVRLARGLGAGGHPRRGRHAEFAGRRGRGRGSHPEPAPDPPGAAAHRPDRCLGRGGGVRPRPGDRAPGRGGARTCAHRRRRSGRSSTSRLGSPAECCSTSILGPRGHLDEGRLFVALAGAIVVASGASYYLNLSPIYTNLVLGFILANSGSAHRDVTRLLLSTERPVYLALLLFAGAAWSPGLGGPALHRPALRADPPGGAVRRRLAIAGRQVASPELRTPDLGRGLLAQGGIGVAIAVNYTQVYPDLAPATVLTATLLSVLLFEIVASREAAAWLSSLREPAPRADRSGDPPARRARPAGRWRGAFSSRFGSRPKASSPPGRSSCSASCC